uniref:Uncharacterized protein n=1 Tax=Aquilaria malaccensis TaxID=223753 RepID=A0A4Y6GLH1_9ROSI|nr:hypothetical protein [Aquilaria malaccensis]
MLIKRIKGDSRSPSQPLPPISSHPNARRKGCVFPLPHSPLYPNSPLISVGPKDETTGRGK